MAKAPSSTSDRECSPCPSGTFSAGQDQLACIPWSVCPADGTEQKAGSSKTDRVCSCDNGGTPKALRDGVSRCSCPLGTWGDSCSLTTLSVNAAASCAIRSDHRLACWRGNSFADRDEQLASFEGSCGIRLDGSLSCLDIGAGPPPSGTFKSVHVDSSYACAVTTSNDLSCWGQFDYGGPPSPPGKLSSFAMSGGNLFAVRADGTLLSWGAPHDGAVQPPPGKYTLVVAGSNGACGILTDGSPVCWYEFAGSNLPERISDLSIYHDRNVCWLDPEGQPGCTRGNVLPPARYASISAGFYEVCGITTLGALFCDRLESGDLGPFTDLSIRGDCGLRTDGHVACVSSEYTPFPDPPERYPGFFTSLVHASRALCGKTAEGRVECDSNTPLPRPALELADGYAHSCEIGEDRTLSCFGENYAAGARPPAGKFVVVAAGYFGSCAIRDDGRVLCWSGVEQSLDTAPSGQFSAVSVGYDEVMQPVKDFACGIRLDGTLACWGAEAEGRTQPPAGRYQAIAVARNHGCALTFEGELQCWGKLAELPPLPSGPFSRLTDDRNQLCLLDRGGQIQCVDQVWFPPSEP